MASEKKSGHTVFMNVCIFIVLLNVSHPTDGTIATPGVAECAKPGIRVGAGVGAVAGGTAGAALLTHLGIGSMTFASCPTLALTTMAGTGTGILAGPLLPIGK